MSENVRSVFVSSTPLSSPRLLHSNKSEKIEKSEPRKNSDLLNTLIAAIEERNFPKVMKLINTMEQFDNIYLAITENEKLKIQLSAAENVAEKLLEQNKTLKQTVMVN